MVTKSGDKNNSTFVPANLSIFTYPKSVLARIFLSQTPKKVQAHSSNSIENATPL